mmetsp:Transcript_56248/g.174861  ORF Transcript_56248/g.174861 Transcript_56248/m.174861 type:complete len:739 (+) Transcript_56248:50-2266(+)
MAVRVVRLGAVLAAVLAPRASGCAAVLHSEVARRAVLSASLPSEVSGILRKHPHVVDAGAPFPDYLYACGSHHEDGEYAHWHKFHHHFVDYIRTRHPDWSRGDEHGAKLVAFLMGVASHYIADINWHGLGQAQTGFIEQVGLMDVGCAGDLCGSAHSTCDTGGEFMVAMQMSSSNVDPIRWWVPTQDIVAVFALANLTVQPSWINECVALFAGEVTGIKASHVLAWPIFAGKSPSLQQNLEDFFIGGMDDMAAWTGLVWREVTGWLQGGGRSPSLERAAKLAEKAGWQPRGAAASSTRASVREVAEGAVEVDIPGSSAAVPPAEAHGPAALDDASAALSYIGSAVAICDVDGDGSPDQVVAAPGQRDAAVPLRGMVSVRFGGTGAGGAPREFTLRGATPLARFGATLACAEGGGGPTGRALLLVASPAEGPWEVTPRPGQDWSFENQSYSGAVRAYEWNGTTMAERWVWKSSDHLGVCGSSLATLGERTVVGCPYSSRGAPYGGRVVMLDEKGVQVWEAHGHALGGRLGSALAGLPRLGLVAAGMPGYRGAGLMATGAVLLLNASTGRPVGGFNSTEAKAQFGRALAADGATLWVGAPGANLTVLQPHAGRVDQMEVVSRAEGDFTLKQRQSLKPHGLGASHFGLVLVAVPGGVAVGSPLADTERGSVQIYSAAGSQTGHAEGASARARFGAALAVSGSTLLIGAPKESRGARSDIIGDMRQGAVYQHDMGGLYALHV